MDPHIAEFIRVHRTRLTREAITRVILAPVVFVLIGGRHLRRRRPRRVPLQPERLRS